MNRLLGSLLRDFRQHDQQLIANFLRPAQLDNDIVESRIERTNEVRPLLALYAPLVSILHPDHFSYARCVWRAAQQPSDLFAVHAVYCPTLTSGPLKWRAILQTNQVAERFGRV